MVASFLGGLWVGKKMVDNGLASHAKNGKSSLQIAVIRYLSNVTVDFLRSPSVGELSRVEKIFGTMKTNAEEAIQKLLEQKKSALQTECDRLESDAKCNIEDKKKRLQKRQQMIMKLKDFAVTLQKTTEEISAMEKDSANY